MARRRRSRRTLRVGAPAAPDGWRWPASSAPARSAPGIGLIATSAWLISRASQRPQESALDDRDRRRCSSSGSRAACSDTGSGSSVTTWHSARWRDLRVQVYERLEALAPAGLPAFRSGDLLARVVHDIDSLQDLLLRVIPPFAIAVGRR